MGCLDNIVGVKGCGETPTGVYVQQLSGITISNFDKAISTEHAAALPALQERVSFATLTVLNEIRQQLETKYTLKSFIENGTLGYYKDDKVIDAAQAGYLTGYQVKIEQTPYLSFYISTLSLFANTTGNVSVLIYDLTQGIILDTITVAAVAGRIVTVSVGKSYPTNKQKLNLFIGYASTFDSYQTTYYNNGLDWGGCGEWCNTCFGDGNRFIQFRPAKILAAGQILNGNIASNTYGAGLSFGYSLQCSFDEYLCNIKNQIAFPVLYKAGQLILEEMRYSTRLTGIVTNFRADNGELAQKYEMKFNQLMTDLMQSMSLNDSICFSCNAEIKTRVVLP